MVYLPKRLFVFCVSAICIESSLCDDDFFEKSERRKSTFEKKLYHGLEKTEGIIPFQKEYINQALKEFQSQKETKAVQNVKKFQSDDIDKSHIRSLASDAKDVGVNAKASLLGSIRKSF
jgi:hypothetical protein